MSLDLDCPALNLSSATCYLHALWLYLLIFRNERIAYLIPKVTDGLKLLIMQSV